MEHLSFSPETNLGTTLSIFAGVREMDSLSATCLDLQEIALFLRKTDYPDGFRKTVTELFGTLDKTFVTVADLIRNGDKDAVRAVNDTLSSAQTACDALISEIMDGPDDIDGKGAVATTLTARYFKRIARLLNNITAASVRPIHEISHD